MSSSFWYGLWLLAALLCTGSPRAAGQVNDFSFPDARGGYFHLAEHRGKIVLLYFGFTRCPDICPTSLSLLVAVLNRIGPQASEVIPVFVSIDPENENAAGLVEYVHFFHPSIVPLLSSTKETNALASRYGASFRRVNSNSAMGYSMDHSANFYLIDRRGRLVRILPHGLPEIEFVKALSQVLAAP